MDVYQKYRDFELSEGVTIRQFQMKLLEIFKYLIKICEENNLTYWLAGGSMLGAVRHKGFIPWDDDLDVFLPRKDYEKLYEIWDKVADTSKYRLVRTNREHNYHHTAMNLVDMNSTYINKHNENEDIFHGCYIDIIPFEGCPKGKLKQWIQIYHSIMYCVFNCQRLPDNQGRLLRLPVKILLSLVRGKKLRYKLWKYHEKKMAKYDFFTSKYVKETVTNFKALLKAYDRKDFDTIDAKFEDLTVKIPAGYDTHLRYVYGDYMAPPKNLDTCMNSRYDLIKYINLNEPFTKYKGIYYLENN